VTFVEYISPDNGVASCTLVVLSNMAGKPSGPAAELDDKVSIASMISSCVKLISFN